MTRALVGLVRDRPPTPGFIEAASALVAHARCVVNPPEPVAGWLATSPAAPVSGRVVAWWEPGDPLLVDADLLLIGSRGAPHPVVETWPGPDLSRRPALTPFLRSRWRRREGLDDEMVVVVDEAGGRIAGGGELSGYALPAALAVASAVVVTGPRLVEALACAAPCITDARSAAEVEAQDGVHVLITEHGDPADGRELSRDWPRAARLGRAGRRLVAEKDVSLWRDRVLAHLGLSARCSTVGAALSDRLTELGEGPASPMCDRAAAAVAGWR